MSGSYSAPELKEKSFEFVAQRSVTGLRFSGPSWSGDFIPREELRRQRSDARRTKEEEHLHTSRTHIDRLEKALKQKGIQGVYIRVVPPRRPDWKPFSFQGEFTARGGDTREVQFQLALPTEIHWKTVLETILESSGAAWFARELESRSIQTQLRLAEVDERQSDVDLEEWADGYALAWWTVKIVADARDSIESALSGAPFLMHLDDGRTSYQPESLSLSFENEIAVVTKKASAAPVWQHWTSKEERLGTSHIFWDAQIDIKPADFRVR